jgi:hypothetical protein
MRYFVRALLAGGLGFAASVLVACGGNGGLLSSNQAGSLNNQLDQVAAAVNGHQCSAAVQASASFSRFVNGLPSSVNPTLANNLKQGAAAIDQLTLQDCGRQATTKTPTTSTQTKTTPTVSTQTNTTPTNTTTKPTNSGTGSTPTPPPPATTGTGPGTSTGGTGGAPIGGGGTSTGGNGGAGTGNGNGQ